MVPCLASYRLIHFSDSVLRLVSLLVTTTSSSAFAEFQPRSSCQDWNFELLLQTPSLANQSGRAQEQPDVAVTYGGILVPASAKDRFASINAEEVHTSKAEVSQK